MLCIYLISTDPFFNLAVDEYLLKNREEDFMVLSVNNPSVIIGKHQVAHREADTRFVSENSIPVIRRISGGGAVFHDRGNLNFSFILNSSEGRQIDFRKYTLPVIRFLSGLGVTASFEGKNDLKVDGLKISGNAEHVYRHRVLHHGTLLFASDLANLRSALRKDTSEYISRGVSSNPSSVMNLTPLVPQMSMNDFVSAMLDYFTNMKGNIIGDLIASETAEIEKLAFSKYRSWDWNYAYGPPYNLEKTLLYNEKSIQLRLEVKDGIINDCIVDGAPEIKDLFRRLTGTRHMPEDIKKVLTGQGIDIGEYNFF
ncbi:MAG TPA: lipoate--protein ligase [Bacteroidales bacterium]|nr:lipoate--protein ligase [Bacteroidales bacterium]HPF03016.1 lipoate--protein ligase [Bacteroidales bacterium]HPJ59959.1 lipoate--protein ligase [Bacteroidales bacterium]HPR13076.1 lipoate--protein ligase [Bacteroidales bacterium]HRW85696.1 lipoate--protein ligase [Bacteroidales bacterium]